ncbi:hypothetical protein SUGI_0518390 [Cryptomeria japonica]|uniref:ATP-dependent Clp protease proteolytic subunit 4, chloroplastic n=1 Tax=Cryptomeria japonica TaxID=3369 RepID=UPI002408B503|nr:ATP-dependent Clp protease proteolytic subunit 4, chloroplastic [Cryptomeria japonica]GLJ26655.1 hypothetical protein SUGI_0518390 [Cryptomeria japonica]
MGSLGSCSSAFLIHPKAKSCGYSPPRGVHLRPQKNNDVSTRLALGKRQMLKVGCSFSSFSYRGSGVVAEQGVVPAQRSGEGDVMGSLLKDRTVLLGNDMDDFVADAIVSQLLLLDAKSPNKDIRLFINCGGGSYSAAMAIFDAIQFCRADVSTIGLGICASTAAIVLAAGTRGKRLAMPNTRIMLHQPMGGISGEVSNVEVQAKEIRFHKINVVTLLSEITGRTTQQVLKDIDRDNYMSPVEAMEYGLIDGVIDQESIVPVSPLPKMVRKYESRPELKIPDGAKFEEISTPEVPDDEIY